MIGSIFSTIDRLLGNTGYLNQKKEEDIKLTFSVDIISNLLNTWINSANNSQTCSTQIALHTDI